MSVNTTEGGLSAPTRHNIGWKEDLFYDTKSINNELSRVFEACHGCRRCVSLCEAFPTLFDLIGILTKIVFIPVIAQSVLVNAESIPPAFERSVGPILT